MQGERHWRMEVSAQGSPDLCLSSLQKEEDSLPQATSIVGIAHAEGYERCSTFIVLLMYWCNNHPYQIRWLCCVVPYAAWADGDPWVQGGQSVVISGGFLSQAQHWFCPPLLDSMTHSLCIALHLLVFAPFHPLAWASHILPYLTLIPIHQWHPARWLVLVSYHLLLTISLSQLSFSYM